MKHYKTLPTRKLFFGEFKYRVYCRVFCGRVILEQGETIKESLTRKRKYAQDELKNRGMWSLYNRRWGEDAMLRIDAANPILLDKIKDFVEANKAHGRLRVEEPTLAYYTSSDKVLAEFVKMFESCIDKDDKNCIINLQKPIAGTLDRLNEGITFIKNDKGFKFKAFMRNGKYSQESREQLLGYMHALSDEFSIGPKLTKKMQRPGDIYLWGGYFYYKKEESVSFLKLIDPGFIARIEKLEVLE